MHGINRLKSQTTKSPKILFHLLYILECTPSYFFDKYFIYKEIGMSIDRLIVKFADKQVAEKYAKAAGEAKKNNTKQHVL